MVTFCVISNAMLQLVGKRPLYDANLQPAQISKIMSTMSEGKFGTLLPKTVFNIVEKGRTILDSRWNSR